MHWFWRAMIAVMAGFLIGPFLLTAKHFGDPKLPQSWKLLLWSFENILQTKYIYVPSLLLAVVIYGLLTRYLHPNRLFHDGETRCRKCGYILRGIPEPRCSECGEKI